MADVRTVPSCNDRPRAVALDYDGTLTQADRPADDVLAALARARAAEIRVALVTGRILSELQQVFPDVFDHVDIVVAENGAVLATQGRIRPLGDAVERLLLDNLHNAGIDARAGAVIVACRAADEHAILDAIARLGLEYQLVHNRSELMVLPSGLNKGTGLLAALAELGVSRLDAVAAGDAENDHSLLAAAGLGVAVANAVSSLRDHAEVVLHEPDGSGVVSLLTDLCEGGRLWRDRHGGRLIIGRDETGAALRIPAKPTNLLVVGGSGEGKSYLAGLLAEQLIDLGYSLLVVDPEGDHVGLGTLRRAVVLGGELPPPSAGTIVSLLQGSDASIVVDLSALTAAAQERYLHDLPVEIEASRRNSGRPHWVFFDEAHQDAKGRRPALNAIDPATTGHCLITWQPTALTADTIANIDIVLAMTSPSPDDALVDLTAAMSRQPAAELAALLHGPTGRVVVARRGEPAQLARLGERSTTHFRHEHKYTLTGLPAARRFWFRADEDHVTGISASNLGQLEVELARCDRAVIRHHATRQDLSRWITDVFHDAPLAAAVRRAELTVRSDSPGAIIEAARLSLLMALQARRGC